MDLDAFRADAGTGANFQALADKYQINVQTIKTNPVLNSIVYSERAKYKLQLLAKAKELALFGTKDTPGFFPALKLAVINMTDWSDEGQRLTGDDAPDEIDAVGI
jgi:hypothetical protein